MSTQKSQLKLGVVLSYVNMAIGSLIPMFYTPLMLNLLGQDEYGLYKLASSVTSYLSLISFGIGSATVRYLTKYRAKNDKEGEENMFGLFNIIFLVISAITIVAGIVIALNIGVIYSSALSAVEISKMQILLIVLTLNTAVAFMSSPYNAVVTSHERFIFLQIINILTTIIIPVANIIALYMGFASVGIACSGLIINIIVRIIYTVYVRLSLYIKPKYNNMPINILKELLIFSFWIFVANVVNQLYSATDTMIIGAIPALATAGVAVYNIGATFNTMMLNFTIGISSVLAPRTNMLVFSDNTNSQLTDWMIRIGRLQSYIIAIVCTGFIAFGRQFLDLWVGPSYLEAYWIAILTMIPACIPLVQSVGLNIIVAQNRHRFRSIVYLMIAIVNVFGTILVVNQFGIIGAAVVTAIAAIIGQTIIMNLYYWKKIKLEIPRFWKSVLKIFIIPVIMCLITLFALQFVVLDNWFTFLIGVIVYSVIFIALEWIFAMNNYEKDIFRKPVISVLNKFKKKDAKGDV